MDKDTGAMFVDRFMSTAMHYPCNYGYVPHTLSLDGDPVDVMVVTPYPLIPGSVIKCRPIGVLKMTDESGDDAKILALPIDKSVQGLSQHRELPRHAAAPARPDRPLLRALQGLGRGQMGPRRRLGRP
jgi:inorganic pyrophosphatase